MRVAVVLMVAISGAKTAQYLRALGKHYELMIARSGAQAIVKAQERRPDLIILDAVSMRTTGERICKSLREALSTVPLVHIHPGPRQQATSEAEVMLFPPLSARRLTDCVDTLLGREKDEVIHVGPFTMNVTRRSLIAHGEEKTLTPKVASLVELFLRNPGKTIERKVLMQRVWETDYLGDTRTLDVHIRWVRDALENGSKKPQYLKTVRGVGYVLAEPED